MTAVAPTLTVPFLPVLRPVRPTRPTGRTVPSRSPRPAAARPASRDERRPRRAVYWRRRALALLVAAVGLVALSDGAGAVFGGGAAVPVRAPRTVHYVVAPGDTLWRIARHLEPGRDPREVVDALISARHTSVVVPGEVIDWGGM